MRGAECDLWKEFGRGCEEERSGVTGWVRVQGCGLFQMTPPWDDTGGAEVDG